MVEGIIYQSNGLDKGKAMDESEKLIKLIKDASDENRISCEMAMEIADKNGVPRCDMGKLLDRLKIKIRNCQLGCF